MSICNHVIFVSLMEICLVHEYDAFFILGIIYAILLFFCSFHDACVWSLSHANMFRWLSINLCMIAEKMETSRHVCVRIDMCCVHVWCAWFAWLVIDIICTCICMCFFEICMNGMVWMLHYVCMDYVAILLIYLGLESLSWYMVSFVLNHVMSWFFFLLRIVVN